MMSPKQPVLNPRGSRSSPIRQTPLQVIHVIGNLMRIWSVYSMYHYLSHQQDQVVVFIFSCLVPASIIFLLLQKPWKGKPLHNSQVVPSVVNGGIMAVYFVLWGKGLLSCGPLIALLAEYGGAVLGVLSAVLYGRRVNLWKKVGGLAAMLASFYLLAIGWATRTHSPFYSTGSEPLDETNTTKQRTLGFQEMAVPISVGILSALRRVIARRVSLKLKRRLHAITVASATCFLFPLAMWDTILGSTSDSIVKMQLPSWAYLSTILFGVVFIFYIDNVAEERLHLVFSSPRHLMAAGGCIIVMELSYNMDFSLLGFLICSSILGFVNLTFISVVYILGIFEATSLERSKRGPLDNQEISDETFQDQLQMSPLPT